MEDEIKAIADTERATIAVTAVTIAEPSTLTEKAADDHCAPPHAPASNGSSITGDNASKLAAELYDSDTTLQSEQDNVTLKLSGSETKDFPPDQTLQQLLKAHSEQNTVTAACIAVGPNRPSNAVGEPNATEALDAKSVSVAGTSNKNTAAGAVAEGEGGVEISAENETTPTASIRSIGSLVCRICHNSENPERLVSPCSCKGSLTYVHIHCLERWISTSRSTSCELCQFQYNTEQTLRYTCFQSLRIWYSRSMSRRALQEDCQMFSLLTLVAFGIIGTLLVGIQYYFLQAHSWGMNRIWTKGWLIFFLFTTLAVYFMNIYMIVRSQLSPWYRWWQSARDIKLILENRKPFQLRQNRRSTNRQLAEQLSATAMFSPVAQQQQQQQEQFPFAPQAQPQPPAAPPVQPTSAMSGIGMQLAQLPELPAFSEYPELLELQNIEAAYKVPLTAAAAVEIPLLEEFVY